MAKNKSIITPNNEKALFAMEEMSAEIETARRLYGDGQPFDEERVLDCIVFKAERTSQELYELGKYCLWLKAEIGHGRFLEVLQQRDINITAANWAMLMVKKFGDKFCTVQNLGTRKARLLTAFTKEEIDEYVKGGALKGIPHGDVATKTYSELAETVKRLNAKVESQKNRHEDTVKKMSTELEDLRMKYENQWPLTKEQTALAALFELNKDYTFALAEVNASIRKAHAIVVKAEKIPGTDALMLNGWFNQYCPEMETFAALHQAWTDEVDNASPIEVGKIIDGALEGENV